MEYLSVNSLISGTSPANPSASVSDRNLSENEDTGSATSSSSLDSMRIAEQRRSMTSSVFRSAISGLEPSLSNSSYHNQRFAPYGNLVPPSLHTHSYVEQSIESEPEPHFCQDLGSDWHWTPQNSTAALRIQFNRPTFDWETEADMENSSGSNDDQRFSEVFVGQRDSVASTSEPPTSDKNLSELCPLPPYMAMRIEQRIRLEREEVKTAILCYCSCRPCKAEEMAKNLGYTRSYLTATFLKPMVQTKELVKDLVGNYSVPGSS